MKKRYHVSGTITYEFVGSVVMDADDAPDLGAVEQHARDWLHDGGFQGSYSISDDEIDVDPNAEEV